MTGQKRDNDERSIRLIESVIVEAAGNKPKKIREFIGRVASGDSNLSLASMLSPSGWAEAAQTPEFDEYTVVLRGELHVTVAGRTEVVHAGQALHVPRGIEVKYATPGPEGAEYVALCVPAFSPDKVHRAER